MPTLKQSGDARFVEYDLTDEERNNTAFNVFQVAWMQNERAMVANAMIEQILDPEHRVHFVQNQAYLRGKLAMVEELLGISPRSMEFPQPEAQPQPLPQV